MFFFCFFYIWYYFLLKIHVFYLFIHFSMMLTASVLVFGHIFTACIAMNSPNCIIKVTWGTDEANVKRWREVCEWADVFIFAAVEQKLLFFFSSLLPVAACRRRHTPADSLPNRQVQIINQITNAAPASSCSCNIQRRLWALRPRPLPVSGCSLWFMSLKAEKDDPANLGFHGVAGCLWSTVSHRCLLPVCQNQAVKVECTV